MELKLTLKERVEAMLDLKPNHLPEIRLIKDQQARIDELEDDARFIWRWIERCKWDEKETRGAAIDILVHYPNAPWNKDRKNWDTSHKEYDAEINKFIAKQALSEAGKI